MQRWPFADEKHILSIKEFITKNVIGVIVNI